MRSYRKVESNSYVWVSILYVAIATIYLFIWLQYINVLIVLVLCVILFNCLGCISEIFAHQPVPKISCEVDLMLRINIFYRSVQ